MFRDVIRARRGFTLIELVIVLLILIVLAAIAVSNFINVETDARTATVKGMQGALQAVVMLSRAQHKLDGGSGSTVDMDGTSVSVDSGNGVPCAGAAGIQAGLFSFDGFAAATTGTACSGSATTTFQPNEGGSATCQVEYDESDGSTTVTSTGC